MNIYKEREITELEATDMLADQAGLAVDTSDYENRYIGTEQAWKRFEVLKKEVPYDEMSESKAEMEREEIDKYIANHETN